MNEKLEELLYDALKPEIEPAPDLNRQILDWRTGMKKWNIKKTAATAACCCIVLAGGVSAYAAAEHFSLLSMFKQESTEVQENASKLLDTTVAQEPSENKAQSELVSFQIKEAICDKNQVIVQVEARATDPEKYLLIPLYVDPAEESINTLEGNIKGTTDGQTIADYAQSVGKKCLGVEATVACNADSLSMQDYTNADGSILFNIRFENTEKTKKLDYVCETFVASPEGSSEDTIRDQFAFTLTDKSNATSVRYLPVSQEKVKGTNLVVDEVVFEKSDLEIVCKVNYHYVGNVKDWQYTTDADIAFFMLDADGKIIQSNGGGSTTPPDGTKEMTQSWSYSLMDLPDTITFQAKDVFEKDLFGTVNVKLAQ